MFKRLVALCLGISLVNSTLPVPAKAQLNSNTGSVALSAPLLESLAVVAAPSSVSFVLVGSGTANGSSSISITTTWVLAPTRSNVKLFGYFTSSSAALTDGAGHNIPSADVNGSVNGGAQTAFTSNSPFATGSSLQVFSQNVSGATLNSSRTDSLALQIDTSGLNLPAATYTGTLNIEAQAN